MDTLSEPWVRVSLADQRLELLEDEDVRCVYPVSTSAKGAGERMGSEMTPRGRHEVRSKIGADAPSRSVFMSRQPTGEICTPELAAAEPSRDWILSRIIWLDGVEPGRNCSGNVDTMLRYIYIHGTADEDSVGKPRSHGCIRMRNHDIIELFDQVEPGTLVEIVE